MPVIYKYVFNGPKHQGNTTIWTERLELQVQEKPTLPLVSQARSVN